jgi:hypothetical protein
VQYAGLLTPAPGATGLQVLAYNYLAPGTVEVDDILLLPVLPPLDLSPAVGSVPIESTVSALERAETPS